MGAPTPAQFAVLLALGGGERHGYAIMKESGAGLGPGTLYRSISQLLAAGLIVEVADRVEPDPADDQRRRYYRLTDDGREVARAEAVRLAGLVERAQHNGLLAPGSA
jgi:DNA-binding PadR family transcriptional regulator